MKKEKIEFTILRYLGRPPSLFDDDAIAAVAKILADNPKFDWEQFTEYATFHKLSQTLYPNLLTYNKSGSAKMRKCESSRGENAGNAELQLGKKENRQSNVECRDSEKEKTPLTPALAKGRCQTSSDGGVISAPKIPEAVINKFRGIFLANAARNEFLAQELVKINKLMADNGIEMLNWKGPTLAIQAYGDLSLRQFKDLDTLVKHEDLEKAKAILLENGTRIASRKYL